MRARSGYRRRVDARGPHEDAREIVAGEGPVVVAAEKQWQPRLHPTIKTGCLGVFGGPVHRPASVYREEGPG